MAKKHIVETPITNKQDWLENRLLDVTSTEVSCLFDLNPFKSQFQLYNEKKEKFVESFDNSRMYWGRKLEKSIAEGCAEELGFDIEPFNVYISNTKTRMGSSFDYKITSGDEVGIMEVKNVDFLAYKDKWEDDGEGTIVAPPVYELQLQHQMEVADINWGCIVALVGGNTMKVVKRDRDRAIGEMLRTQVHHFWDRIKLGMPPDIDFENNSQYLIKNVFNQTDPSLILSSDENLDKLIDDYLTLNKAHKDNEKQLKGLKAQIFEASNGAVKIISDNGTVHCGMTKGSKGTFITKDMVGTYINAKNPYRQLRITQPKPQGANK